MARNKEHKQRFGSKHALAEKSKGRQVGTGAKSTSISMAQTKERMKQAAGSLRAKKAKAALAQKRLGSSCGIPRIIGVIPANESGNTDEVVNGFCRCLGAEPPASDFGPITVSSKERRAAFTFISERNCNDQDCVDVAKVADIVVLTLDASQAVQETIKNIQEQLFDGEDETQSMATTWFSDVGLCITDFTRDLVTALNSQGTSGVVVILQNLHTFTEKQKQKVLKVHQRYFLSVLHDSSRVAAVDDDTDLDNILRHMQVCKLRQLKWREQHPYFAVEGAIYDADLQQLKVCGHLRGMPLSAQQIVHITNYGSYQVSSISLIKSTEEKEVLDTSEENQRESLQQVQANSTLEADGLPTEDDVLYHQEEEKMRKIRVPAGVSEYQAAWYDTEENAVHEDALEFHSGGADDEGEMVEDAMSYRTTQTDTDFLKAEDVVRLERMTDEERAAEMEHLKELSEEEAWNPDMIDTPIDIPARQRFAKYRGLKSFHTGKWDHTENLPTHYAYIYRLQGYSRIKSAALEKCNSGCTEIGQFIEVTLESVSPDVWESCQDRLLIVSGQLEHEQKWSVLHFQVQRCSEHDEPIKSKTPMLAHIGFRKFYVSPLFSDVSSGDRTKFSRFFHEGDKFRLATFFGPISYNPCPILLFQVPSLEEQSEGQPLRLACFGGSLPPNPDLLLLKRTVLTGRVAVIHKKQIVVKYMFFNDEDVKWFQPVDLYTKLGRRGKILKAVGMHGLYKAALNDQVMQHDVVCMDLFKRVFPKWTTVAFNICDIAQSSPIDANEDE